MAIRADHIQLVSTRLFGVQGVPTIVPLEIETYYLPEDLSELTFKSKPRGAPADARWTTLRASKREAEVHRWSFDVVFEESGHYDVTIEWRGHAIEGGDCVPTTVESGARVRC